MGGFIGDREITDYLKGFAILSVYGNHFINRYVSMSFVGYANGFISIFFILSGYGIFISLSRITSQNSSEFLIHFFKKRFLRIYPLFWVWCILHGFSNGFLGFFALDIINPKSPWFVPSIIQCYLFAPILFIFFRNSSIKKCMFIMTLVFILLNFISIKLRVPYVGTLFYQGLFFHHIFLFSLGFILAKIESIKEMPFYMYLLCAIMYLFFIHETTPQHFLEFPFRNILISFIFPFTLLLFCYSTFIYKGYLPLRNTLKSIGKYAYSIYLFQGAGFFLLVKFDLVGNLHKPFVNLVVGILSAPVFICLYSILEITTNEFILGDRDIKKVITRTKQMIYSFNLLPTKRCI